MGVTLVSVRSNLNDPRFTAVGLFAGAALVGSTYSAFIYFRF